MYSKTYFNYFPIESCIELYFHITYTLLPYSPINMLYYYDTYSHF